MYFIISSQNCLDSTVPGLIPLGLTNDPSAALSMARTAAKSEYKPFIDQILIYDVEVNKAYTHADLKEKNSPLAYLSFQNMDRTGWVEVFFEDFKVFNKRSIGVHDKAEQKAALGKFRAVIIIDADTMQQIDNDTDTREEAYNLCIQAAGTMYAFCVYDDQGKMVS